jgi:predicted  nucleic acid-binding Zn-ribbon protein
MEPATIIARPDFDDIVKEEPARASTARQHYASEELGEAAEERTLEPLAPFEDRRPPPREDRSLREEQRPFTTVYGALDSERSGERRSVRLSRRGQLTGKSAQQSDAMWEEAAESQELVARRSALKERFAGPDLDIEDAAEEPVTGHRRVDRARLAGGRRSDIHTKRLAGSPENAIVLSELAKRYSREYTGREGWSAGAIADSVVYALRVAGRTAGRTMAIRRLRTEREGRERIRSDQLSELGEVALSLRDLDNALLDDYRNRLLELHQDQEMRADEVDSLNQQIETSRRSFTQAERHAVTQADELVSQTKQTEDKLRPVETGYRTALKAARNAEEDARALARQIDHTRGELSRMSGAETSGDEAARLKARVERWTSERDGLLREVPRLEEKAVALEPEIERLRKDAERCKSAEREQRETALGQEAEHKREVQRLEGEVERIRVAIENIAGQRRSLFQECGRQLDIDRPVHDHLEEIYGELDATAAEIRRFDHEIEIAQAKPEPPDYGALSRAGVALFGVIAIVFFFIWAIS